MYCKSSHFAVLVHSIFIWILARYDIVRLRTISYVPRTQHRTYDFVRTMLHTTLNIRHHMFVNIVGAAYDIVGQTYNIVGSIK
jgi:hypothetical protein